jgi:hypothetical protein
MSKWSIILLFKKGVDMSRRKMKKKIKRQLRKGNAVSVDFGDCGFFISPTSCSDEELDDLLNLFFDLLCVCEIENCDLQLVKTPRLDGMASFQGNPPTELQ